MAGLPGCLLEIPRVKSEPAENEPRSIANESSEPDKHHPLPYISPEITVTLSENNETVTHDGNLPLRSSTGIASTSNFWERMWEYALRRNVEYLHRENPKPKLDDLNQKPNTSSLTKEDFPCSHCDFSTNDEISLRHHVLLHSTKKYVCEQCQYTTSSLWSLRAHVRTHTGERPYACPHCSYRATLHQHLKSHILTHTGAKPRQCPFCDYRCRESGALKKHISTHTGERPHSCPHCDYRCSRLGHLKRHIMIHTGEKPYACPHCPYRCIQMTNLEGHIRKCHTSA